MIRILAIDDEPAILDLEKIALERTGEISVDTESSPYVALERIRAAEYDAVICDYQMHQMTGIEVLQEVRARDPLLPFIIFTGKGREDVVIDAINGGADSYVQKGTDVKAQFAELEHKIRQAVGKRRVEDALFRSEEKYRFFVNNLPGIAMYSTIDRKISFMHGMVEEITGYTAGELLAQEPGWERIVHPDDCGRVMRAATTIMTTPGHSTSLEFRIIRRDGSHAWLEGHVQNVCDEQGAPTAFTHLLFDETEKKSAQEALLSAEREKAAILDSVNEKIFLMDPDLNIIWSNRRGIESAHAIGLGDPVGRRCHTFWLQRDEPCPECPAFKAMENGVPASSEMATPDGRIMKLAAHPVMDEAGRIIGAVETISDITESVEAERAIRESEVKYRELVENANSIILKLDADGRVVFFNEYAEHFFGFSADEILGRPVLGTITPPTTDGVGYKEMFSSICRDPAAYEVTENEHITRDGRRVWIRWTNRLILDGEGLPSEVLCVGHDITGILHSQKALRAINKKMNLLSGITRHDILNQINSIEGYISLMGDEPVKEWVDYMAGIQRLTDMIRREIIFTKDYQDMGVNEPRWQLLEPIVERLRARMDLGGIRLISEIGPCEIYADPLLERVFFNLFENSIRHGGGISVIRVSFRREEGDSIILVEDDGDGIREDFKEPIFEKGFGRNTGFGLFLAREVLGITSITIMETGLEGKGARFEIRVPPDAYRTSGA